MRAILLFGLYLSLSFLMVACSSPKGLSLDCVRTSETCTEPTAATCQYHAKFKFTDANLEIQSDDLAVFGAEAPKYIKARSVTLTEAQTLLSPTTQLSDGETNYDLFSPVDGGSGVQLLVGQKLQGDSKKAGVVWIATNSNFNASPEVSTGVVYNCQK